VPQPGDMIQTKSLNDYTFKTALKKAGLPSHFSLKNTRTSFITNSLDEGERISFIQQNVGHTTPNMIIKDYYGHTASPDDGSKLTKAFFEKKVASIPPYSEDSDLQVSEILKE
jgi:integrase